MVAIDKAGLAVDQVFQRADLERIAALDHQPHLARNETDDTVFTGIEPLLAGPDPLGAQFAARQMHAGEIASPLRQRDQRILITDVTQIDADTGLAVQQFPQLRDRKAVAGVNADHGRALMQEGFDLGRKFLRKILQLRAETRLHALTGPYQLLAEGREFRALAALGFDQRDAEKPGPLFEQVPDMPVGQLRFVRRAGDLAGFTDLVEDPEHNHHSPRAALPVKSPDRLDLDV